MQRFRRRMWILLSCALPSALLGLFTTATPVWPLGFFLLYLSGLTAWRGLRARRRYLRAKREVEWWKQARRGVPQEPLDPCCMRFAEHGLHATGNCTRNGMTRGRIRLSREDVEHAWKDIVADLENMEHGEGT